MKKMYLVLVALVMAVGFSAYTPFISNRSGELTYEIEENQWAVYEGDPCSLQQVPVCMKVTEHGLRQLFYDNNINDPVFGEE